MELFRRFWRWLLDMDERVVPAYLTRARQGANMRTFGILLVIGGICTSLYLGIVRPPADFPLNTLVSISEGASLSQASAVLVENHVVRSGITLQVIVWLSGNQKVVHAGDYLFKTPQNIFSIARAISIGAFGLEPVRIRIPEGATAKEMADIFKGQLMRFDSQKFLVEAQPQEGYLFPDTYFFLPNVREDAIIKAMRQNFDVQTATIADKIASSGKSMKDIVIMASLLEREAHKPEDRRIIAGVLWKRLKEGMLLQVDATFFYFLDKPNNMLTTEDLKIDSPYNTYKYKGLPPGPIGSPSLNAILSAVTPIDRGYLYYLADKNGVTHFSKTYAEHLRNKRRYIP